MPVDDPIYFISLEKPVQIAMVADQLNFFDITCKCYLQVDQGLYHDERLLLTLLFA
jgi:hypothetical protein